MAKKKSKFKEKCKNLGAEFKKFISKGNAVDMAVGVVIGGAFSAIVKALTDILLQLATWGVPGGLSGLITVLPPANQNQIPPDGYQVSYTTEQWLEVTKAWKPEEIKMYTTYGTMHYFNKCAIINWGAFINAVISFLIIGLTLFTIVKVVKYIGKKRKEFQNKIKEQYYEKHPDERPEEVKKEVPVTELSCLKEMTALMRNQAYSIRPRSGVNAHRK